MFTSTGPEDSNPNFNGIERLRHTQTNRFLARLQANSWMSLGSMRRVECSRSDWAKATTHMVLGEARLYSPLRSESTFKIAEGANRRRELVLRPVFVNHPQKIAATHTYATHTYATHTY